VAGWPLFVTETDAIPGLMSSDVRPGSIIVPPVLVDPPEPGVPPPVAPPPVLDCFPANVQEAALPPATRAIVIIHNPLRRKMEYRVGRMG